LNDFSLLLWYNTFLPIVCCVQAVVLKILDFGGINVKRLAVAVLIISVVIFGMRTTFSKAETKNGKATAKAAPERAKTTKDANTAVDANKIADVNQAAGEPNEIEELEKGFKEASKVADKEYQEVMRQSTENRVKMMTALQNQTVSELEYIRSLAVQEGATKTAKAVDLAIEKRKARYDEMIQNMKERQEREEQRAEREAKKERTERDHSPRRRTRQ
jgi:hypothetical protein